MYTSRRINRARARAAAAPARRPPAAREPRRDGAMGGGKAKKVSATGRVIPKSTLKAKRGTTRSASSRYVTRNQALHRLQLKLGDFRRLCILKGIHPREPRRKHQGQGKTYYHVKDIAFLHHEPLLEKFRELRAYARKLKRAKAKQNYVALDRLRDNTPRYELSHLVLERYPTFKDALGDLDDPMAMCALFAVLPTVNRHDIAPEIVEKSERLSREFKSFCVRTHALRKVFISVKGIYYEAEIQGEKITWLEPHALAQTMPEDVDYRVMLTFLEFYHDLMSFVNFKLYKDAGLQYPPTLNEEMDDAAAGLAAVVHKLAKQADAANARALPANSEAARAVESRAQSLKEKLALIAEHQDEEEDDDEDAHMANDDDEDGGDEEMTPEQRECARLFDGLVFFINREVPRNMMVFIIKSFGGEVCWDGDGSPYDADDSRITHVVIDRPTKNMKLNPKVVYVQPQWVCDCANWRVLIPPKDYAPECEPPPHLSPFVGADDDGYTPEYAKTLLKLQEETRAIKNGVPMIKVLDDADAEMDEEAEAAAEEKRYRKELEAEIKGVSYSKSLEKKDEDEDEDEDESDDDASDDDASEDEDASEESSSEDENGDPKSRLTFDMALSEKDKIMRDQLAKGSDEEQMKKMSYMLLPRKKRELYKAMQIGIAKKEKRAAELTRLANEHKEKKRAAAEGEKEEPKSKKGKTTKAAKTKSKK